MFIKIVFAAFLSPINIRNFASNIDIISEKLFPEYSINITIVGNIIAIMYIRIFEITVAKIPPINNSKKFIAIPIASITKITT